MIELPLQAMISIIDTSSWYILWEIINNIEYYIYCSSRFEIHQPVYKQGRFRAFDLCYFRFARQNKFNKSIDISSRSIYNSKIDKK